MDPDKTLARLREAIYSPDGWSRSDHIEIFELFTALDGWLSKGGFLPKDWGRRWSRESTPSSTPLDQKNADAVPLRVINLEEVVETLGFLGIEAYVQQTGGGCATLYAGSKPGARDNDDHPYAAAAGPGWFAGPGWTNGRATLTDFYVGPDDDGDGAFAGDWPEHTTEKDVALVIASVVNEYGTAALPRR